MGNEYDYKCKGFELKAVPRSEFEALKRFGDDTELQDGMLMRVEGDKEFRMYCEDVEGCAIGVLTGGVLNLFAELYDDAHPRLDLFAGLRGLAPSTIPRYLALFRGAE